MLNKRIMLLTICTVALTACAVQQKTPAVVYAKAPLPTVAMLNEAVPSAGAQAATLTAQNNQWSAQIDAANNDELPALGFTLFGQCVSTASGLAETADKQADSLRLWQRYGQSVQQFNESLGK